MGKPGHQAMGKPGAAPDLRRRIYGPDLRGRIR